MHLFDCTLRDGANIVGNGFSGNLTISIVKGLIDSNIKDIEVGNCKGLGAYELMDAKQAPSDQEYLKLLQPYINDGRIGMFQLAECAREDLIFMVKEHGFNFLRVGADAGDGRSSVQAVKLVKKSGLICRYSLMKAHISSPTDLADEAMLLEDVGVDKITIMDSTGTMCPQDVAKYVMALKNKLSIPVGFHGHSNLGLSQANAIAAVDAGADEIDSSLLGMARSAGNCATEIAVATFKRKGYLPEVDLYKLLNYLDADLIPEVQKFNYHVAINPTDLMLGLAGCHSNFLSMFKKVSEDENVSLYQLIFEVSAINARNPSVELVRVVAETLKCNTY